MVINKPGKWQFVSSPKCATHTLYQVFVNRDKAKRHGRFHENQIPDKRKNFLTIVATRNPYDRLVSMWLQDMRDDYRVIQGYNGWLAIKAFPNALRNIGDYIKWRLSVPWRAGAPQHQWLKGIRIDRILRLENLEEDYWSLPFVNNRDPLPRIYPAKQDRKPWQEYYNEQAIELANQWIGEDFEIFGYEPNAVAKLARILFQVDILDGGGKLYLAGIPPLLRLT